MKKVKDNKTLLFENMAKLNPDFKLNEGDDKWIQKAVDPEHKGYCTPMTKPTCTPRRKALAKRFKKGIDEATDKGSEIIYTFKTDAITETMDSPNGKQYRHPVYLIKGNPKYAPIYNGVVLSISDTPGSWYVDTLMEGNARNSNIIYIDFGAKWICSNWSEIMRELKEWISNNGESVEEGLNLNAMFPADEYKKKADEIKAVIDNLFQDEDDDALDTLYRLLVRRTAPVKQASPEELQEIFDALGKGENIEENMEVLNERLVTFVSDIHREISKIPGLTRINFWSLANGFVGLYRYEKDGNAYEIEIRPVQLGQYKGLWGNQIKKKEERNGQ